MPTHLQTSTTPIALPSQAWPAWGYPYSAGLKGGLVAGAVTALAGAIYGLASGQPWLLINAVAATLLRDLQARPVEQLGQFDASALLAGLAVHLTLSLALGALFTVILPTLPGRPLYWGLIVGPLLGAGALVAVLPVADPLMPARIDWILIGAVNLLFGLVLGWWIDRTPIIRLER